jgi:predicted acylesterase/phospholipase RssA
MRSKSAPNKRGKSDQKKSASPFTTLVFAGGGNRCLWSVGFWTVAAPALKIKPDTVAGVSAGAAMACLTFAGTWESTMEYFKSITGRNRKNVYPGNIFSDDRVFPHEKMYRSGILHGIDARALLRLHQGPDIRILVSRPPAWLGPRWATLVGIAAYSLEKKFRNPVHPLFAARLGFTAEVVSVRECKTPDELADLILASSCTPPFTPIMRLRGKIALDGGLIDNVPVRALGGEEGRALVLLTRRYPEESIPRLAHRTYVQPSVPIAIDKWDYTNPRGMQDAFDLGRRDGEAFVKKYRAGA